MYAQHVRELLEEYARISAGKIKLEVVDPEPFSDAEDKAVAAGVQGVPMNAQGENLYFGLVGTNAVDTKEVIPFFDQRKERFLEYDVSRLLYSLAHPKKKVIGLVSSLQIQGGFTFDPRTRQPQRTPAWQVIDQIRGLFDIKPIPAQFTTIPAEVDVLMLVHPKKLSDEALYAIDQFVMRGGRMMAFVDPLCEMDESQQQGQPTPPAERASDLSKLLDGWGVEVVPGKLAADKTLGLEVQAGTQRPELVQFVVWLGLKKDQFNKEDPVSGQLSTMNFGTAGIIQEKSAPAAAAETTPPPAGLHATITPLVHTTATAMEMPAEIMGMKTDPKNMLSMYVPGTKELVLAARLGGEVNSAFPNGAPQSAAGAMPPAPPATPSLAKSEGPINVILVADADMLADRLWVQQQNFFGQTMTHKFADNGDFVLSALDNLSGSTDLISVRARKEEARPFTLVDQMHKKAQDRYHLEEDALEKSLTETEQKLADLQTKKEGNALVLSPEQKAEIEKFKGEYASTHKQLRTVRLNLNKDIETLGTKLKFINIGLIPALVSLGAVGLGALRASRRRRASKQ
jgi:ABC-type uncharacterized transport system involved in gliding motility auxiliary subunit